MSCILVKSIEENRLCNFAIIVFNVFNLPPIATFLLALLDNLSLKFFNILFASYGCVGTGLTLKNIDYGIFAQSFKSEIVVLQSIGRGLLKTETKDKFNIYDIIDVLPTQKIYTQGLAKIKTYKERKYEYNIIIN